ncbi:MAG: Non-motile and phage-resistance protein [Pseudomonadota bacterium]|jgi:PAS domain S-box-containing protein
MKSGHKPRKSNKRMALAAVTSLSGAATLSRLTRTRAIEGLVQSGPPSYVVDLDGRIVYASPRYEQMADEVRGPVRDPLEPAFDLSEIVTRIIAGEEEIAVLVPLCRNDADVTLHSRHFPIRDEAGTLVAIGGIYRESTLQWREMNHVKERYEDISRLSFDLIWETDADFRLTYMSPRVTEALGYHPREMYGRSLLSLGTVESGGEALTMERRSPFRNLPLTATHRDGRIRQFKLSGLPMFAEESGAFRGFRGTATDVSAEQEARESATLSRDRLTMAIENISEGFALYDSHNRLVLCNNRLREYLAGAARVLFPGAPFHGILHGFAERDMIRAPADAMEQWLALRERAERDGEASIEIALRTGRWLRVHDRPTEGGGIVSIVSDITEIKEREETLRAAKELAEQGSRSKSEFLANMSHELRTPLNAIIGFSQIMRAQTLGPVGSPRYLEYLDDIIESSEHLLGVINDILDVAKSEAGKLDLYEEVVDVEEEMALTGRLFAEQAAEAKVALNIHPPRGIARLSADRRKIRQILLNLVSNAIKFTPPGGKVDVTATMAEDGGLTLTVSDTGIGIRKEDIARALAPFGQVESSLSRRYEGTGLGLPLTQSLVERHGGRLLLDSEPGKGTRVSACFPPERSLR